MMCVCFNDQLVIYRFYDFLDSEVSPALTKMFCGNGCSLLDDDFHPYGKQVLKLVNAKLSTNLVV